MTWDAGWKPELGGRVKSRPGRLEGAVAGDLGRRLEAGATRRGVRVGLLPRAN